MAAKESKSEVETWPHTKKDLLTQYQARIVNRSLDQDKRLLEYLKIATSSGIITSTELCLMATELHPDNFQLAIKELGVHGLITLEVVAHYARINRDNVLKAWRQNEVKAAQHPK